MNTKSFRSLLINALLCLTTTIVLIVMLLTIFKVNDQQHNDMENNTWLWATILSDKSADYLKEDSKKTSVVLKRELAK